MIFYADQDEPAEIRPRDFCALSPAEGHRLRSGLEHAAQCGTRPLCEVVLRIFEKELAFAEFLESLDDLRRLDPNLAAQFLHDRNLTGTDTVTASPTLHFRHPQDILQLVAGLLQ